MDAIETLRQTDLLVATGSMLESARNAADGTAWDINGARLVAS